MPFISFVPLVWVELDMAVNSISQSGVHGNDADTAGHFAVVGNFLRTENDLLAVFFNVRIESLQSVRGRGQGRAGNHVDLVLVDQVEHAVLNNFGVHGQVLEVGINKAVDDGVGHVAYAGLQREQVFRKSAVFHFVLQEGNEVVAHLFSVVIEGSQRTGDVRQVAGNDSRDFGNVARNVRGAYAIACFADFDRLAERRVGHFNDVGHAFESHRLSRIDFDDDFLALGNEYRGVADSGGRNDADLAVAEIQNLACLQR